MGFTTRWRSGWWAWDPNVSRTGRGCTPPIGAALEMVGLEEINEYIALHQNTVAQYIVTCPIMDLCLEAE